METAHEEQLTKHLRGIFIQVNSEARLAAPDVLERCMDAVFSGAGADWLIDTAERWGLADANSIRHNAEAWAKVLETDEGQDELRRQLGQRRNSIEDGRRKLVSLIRLFHFGKEGMEFQFESLPDSGGIYKILSERRKHGTDVHDH